MKVIAMYLPQFYQNKENDEWWGEGYTDWVAVKKANKLFDNHYEPRIPLHNNYYNLLSKETMKWQADLMSRYNVYGMCFYHYWFKDGKQVLEKPAENLLRWKDIDMPFCFSWANETWARSWSKIGNKNSWCLSEDDRKKQKDNDNGILLEQNYGNEQDWINHFMYLLPFFKDRRYICIENKPIFIIYKPELIDCFYEMKELWNNIAIENGFNGIYFIATNVINNPMYDASVIQQPAYTIGKSYMESTFCDKYPINKSIDYEDFWENIINENIISENKVYIGGIVGFDDTPRRGSQGISLINSSPEIFEKYLKQLMKINEQNGNDIVFLNAWNEWGEGMYLEPDERSEYSYLQAVKNSLETYKNVKIDKKENIVNQQSTIDRYKSYWIIMDKWLSIKEENKSLELFFKKHNMMNIAIYGMGMLGKHLIKELEDTKVNILYGIDRFIENKIYDLPLYKIEDDLPKVDVVVVTATYDFDKIYDSLSLRFFNKIISLEDIVQEIFVM